ncbi:MAG: PAS domain-containing sensor histidine kinase, partial [Myxococcales bacterium]
MSDLANLLEPRLEELIRRWTARIDAVIAPDVLPEPVLRDHIEPILRELLRALRQLAVPDSIVHARTHGQQRYRVGFPIDALVREYGVLRSIILDLVEESGQGISLAEVRLLTDFIAAAIAEGVQEYDQRRASAEQALGHEVREREGQLHARDSELRLVMDAVPFLLSFVTADERYRLINRSYEDWFGLTHAQLEGRTVREVIGEAAYAVLGPYVQRALAGELVTVEQPGVPYRHGGTRDVKFTLIPRHDEAGQVEGYVTLLEDITERHQLEREREALVEELTRSNQALDQFAHVASHDLKAPLRGIGNLAQWIEDDLGDAVTDDAREKLNLMRGRVRHLERMITSILDFATAGRRKAKPEPIDLSTLLTGVVELLAPPEHIAITIGDDLPALEAERAPLQQVFMNLLGNAVKHTQQPGASVRVDAADEGPSVHFTVADNGPGIAP